MKRLTRKALASDPDLDRRFHHWLRSEFSWDRINGCVLGPYVSRTPQRSTLTQYWHVYGHFEGDWFWSFEEQNLIKFLVKGSWSLEADHIFHNGLDNREYNDAGELNLRFVPKDINQLNRRETVNNTSGYPGVVWHDPSWRVQTTIKRQRVYYGVFPTVREAAVKSQEVRKSLGMYAPPIPETI